MILKPARSGGLRERMSTRKARKDQEKAGIEALKKHDEKKGRIDRLFDAPKPR